MMARIATVTMSSMSSMSVKTVVVPGPAGDEISVQGDLTDPVGAVYAVSMTDSRRRRLVQRVPLVVLAEPSKLRLKYMSQMRSPRPSLCWDTRGLNRHTCHEWAGLRLSIVAP